MRGQSQANALRLRSTPARERVASWVDARLRKRQSDRVRRVEVIAAIEAEGRRRQRSAGQRPDVALPRRPY